MPPKGGMGEADIAQLYKVTGEVAELRGMLRGLPAQIEAAVNAALFSAPCTRHDKQIRKLFALSGQKPQQGVWGWLSARNNQLFLLSILVLLLALLGVELPGGI